MDFGKAEIMAPTLAALLPYVMTGLGAAGSLLSKGKSRSTDLARQQLEKIVGQGGLGFSPGQLGQLYQQYRSEVEPQMRRAELGADIDATRRGIYDSPLAVAQKGQARQSGEVKLANIWKQLQLENQQMKNASLLSALAELARYGDIERARGAQGQQMWLNLFEAGLSELLD